MIALIDDIIGTIRVAQGYWIAARMRRGKDWCHECRKIATPDCPYQFVMTHFPTKIKVCEMFEERKEVIMI